MSTWLRGLRGGGTPKGGNIPRRDESKGPDESCPMGSSGADHIDDADDAGAGWAGSRCIANARRAAGRQDALHCSFVGTRY